MYTHTHTNNKREEERKNLNCLLKLASKLENKVQKSNSNISIRRSFITNERRIKNMLTKPLFTKANTKPQLK